MKITEILQKNAEAAKKYIDTLLKKKQDVLTFDTIPTADSKNPVTSNGIKKAIDACPDKNGTGARGTWPISVGGSSAIATKAKQDADGNVIPNTYVKRCEELVCTLDDLKIGGSYAIQTDGYIAVDPTYTDIGHPGSVLVIMNKANGATNSCTQIYTTYDTHNSYKREYDAVKKKWSAWRKYAFEDSTVASAQKLATARKINITGNTVGSTSFDGSGDVSISTTVNESKHATAADTATKVNATATNGGAADLVFGTMAANDYARIRVGGSDDNGWLELATADGGNEPIYARQYGGAYDWPNGRPGTVKNEAVLLDGNGNTKFPHDVTAANFKGHLAGNADSATSATTAGNVSGKIYYSADSPSVATDKLFTVKQAHKGDDNVPNNGLVIQAGPTGAAYNGKLYITDNGGDGVWIGGVASGKEVGWTRLVENKGSWNINSATATKLQTPRTISLTGNASGSGTFDGSGNVSINTTVNSATKATSWGAGTSSLINDIATVNNSDTWIPVVSNGKLQHTEKLNMKVGAAVTAGNADTSAAINYSSVGTNYIKAGSADTGDAANKTANMVIGSWYGITFYNVCGDKIAGGMNVRDGSLTMKGTITGSKVYNAVYNDYAEFFEKDENITFEAGDIVALDTSSEEERYIKATEDSIVVVGVCTHEYAHIIGGKEQTIEENEKEFVPISLMGRVYVKVDSSVKRGDKIAASSVPGIGRKAMPGEHSIGTALTNPYNGKARVLINL